MNLHRARALMKRHHPRPNINRRRSFMIAVLTSFGSILLPAILSLALGQTQADPAKNVPAQEAPHAPRSVQTVALQYASATDIAPLVNGMVKDVRAAADARTNSLIVSGAQHDLVVALDLIQRLDKASSSEKA